MNKTTIAWPIIGQPKAKIFFEKLLLYEKQQPNSLGGTYILSGSVGSGRKTILKSFFEQLGMISQTEVNQYEIVRLGLREDKTEIGVDQVRDFNNQMALSSFGNGYRLGVITEAEKLSTEAGNALLKTLEEAHQGVLIFILAHSIDSLPLTIVSRAQIIEFRPVAVDSIYDWLVSQHAMSRPQARQLARLAQGQPGRALRLAHEKNLLEAELAPIRFLCELFTLPLAQRWQVAEKLLGNLKGPVLASRVDQIINQWRLGLRDIYLLHIQQSDSIIYINLESELRVLTQRLSLVETRRLDAFCQTSLRYLAAHVNPKLVVEQILLNIV